MLKKGECMIWKLLIFVIAGYVLYRLFMNDRNKKADALKNEHEEQISSGNLVKDPICGTYVEKESSISVRDGEHQEFFCSHDCRNKYIARIENSSENN